VSQADECSRCGKRHHTIECNDEIGLVTPSRAKTGNYNADLPGSPGEYWWS